MKKIFFIAITAMISFSAISQSKSSGGSSFSGGLEIGLPMGDFNVTQSLGYGASVHGLFGDKSGFTASIGYMSFSGKSFTGGSYAAFGLTPVKVGYRLASEGGFYTEPQVGISFYTGGSGFTYAPVVGMMTGSLDLSVRYESISSTGSTLSFLGFRLGYKF